MYALYHLRGGAGEHPDVEPSICAGRSSPAPAHRPAPSPAERKPDDPDPRRVTQQQQRPADDPSRPSSSAAAGAPAPPSSPASAAAAAVARRLAGVHTVTLSVLGVLLEERSPEELGEAATVVPGAVGGCWLSLLPLLPLPATLQAHAYTSTAPLPRLRFHALLPVYGPMRPAARACLPTLHTCPARPGVSANPCPRLPRPPTRAGARDGSAVPAGPRIRPLPDVPGGG